MMCYNKDMKLNLIKSLNLRHSIDNALKVVNDLKNESIFIVVPDKLSATMEKLLFEKLNIESTFNIDICTLNRLSKRILAETKASYKSLSKIGSIILLKKVLGDNQDMITSFKNDKQSYEYCNEIYKTLSQLKSCQLSAKELIDYKCEQSQLTQKINDLGNILDLYTKAKSNVLDNSDMLTLTCMMLDKSETVKKSHFVFVGFDDFTSQGYDLIERLMVASQGVYVCTYFSSNANKSIYYQDVFARLVSRCQVLGAKANIIDLPYNDDNFHKYLTSNLFAFNNLGFGVPHDTIRLYQAQNITDEIEYIARDIRNKILNGDRLKNFGVAVYNLANYVDLIKQIFNKYDLCTYIDAPKSFANTVIYKFFTNLFQLYLKDFEPLNLVDFIASPVVKIPENIKYIIIQKIKSCNYRGDLSKFITNDEQSDRIARKLSQFLQQHKLQQNSTIEQIIEWHNSVLQNLDISNTINEFEANLSDMYDRKIIAQAIRCSNTILQEILEFYPTANLQQVADVYQKAGLEQSISPLPISADCVQLMDAGEILTNFPHLYIANCSSSTAPTKLQDVGILLDKELTTVELSHHIEPTVARINRLNKFKLFNSCLMFDQTLCITMSLSSPSETCSLVSELKNRLFVIDSAHNEESLSYIYPHQIRNTENHVPLSLWDMVEYCYTNHLNISPYVKNILNSTNIHPASIEIDIDKRFINLNEISASALETYFQCPFKYLFNYVLKLREPISADIEMLDVGNILHELAYRYYKHTNRQALDIEKFCQSVIMDIALQDEKLSKNINSPVFINLIAEAGRFVHHLQELDANSKFVPTYFEKGFGSTYSMPALPLNNTTILKGKIDRVDFYQNQFRIIDYKSGNADASLTELYYGKKLQLFLYALAIENATGKKLSGTFYLPITNAVEKANADEELYKLIGFYTDDEDNISAYDTSLQPEQKSRFVNITLTKDGKLSKRSNKVLSQTEMREMLDYAKQVVVGALEEIQQAKFKASPLKIDSSHNACSHCPYLVLCSKSTNNIDFRNVSKVEKQSFTGGKDE